MVSYRENDMFDEILSQSCLNFSLLNAVPGSVRFRFGIPFVAMYSAKNSITLPVVEFGKNNALGHPE